MNNNKIYKPNEDKYIYTEGIDYSVTGNVSIWGEGDKETLQLLKGLKIAVNG
ncbi:MAG: hypothetical protein M1355_01010 [Patescibacteria group bacterium]|nr:hypothetical protein [Patescibacteria group bacterium]MCL5093703.1 hypothetical protein [Patescibacteria group bacterium]